MKQISLGCRQRIAGMRLSRILLVKINLNEKAKMQKSKVKGLCCYEGKGNWFEYG
jgi:hypothetical protein